MTCLIIGPNGDARFSEPVSANYCHVVKPNAEKEPETILTTSNSSNAIFIKPNTTGTPIQQPLTAPNTIPGISPNIGINPFPNTSPIQPFDWNPPIQAEPLIGPGLIQPVPHDINKDWAEVMKKLAQGLDISIAANPEKDRVFESLCQYIPDEVVRDRWYNTEEAQKNPIESGMRFLNEYLLTRNLVDAIL